MMVSCGYCKADLAEYQKVGKGNLLRMKVERIVESNFDLSKHEGILKCPSCSKEIGTRIQYDGDKEAYRMIRGANNTRRLDY